MSHFIINPYVYAATGLDQLDNNYYMEFDAAATQYVQTTQDLSSLTACSISCWVKFDFTATGIMHVVVIGNVIGAGDQLAIAKRPTSFGADSNKFYIWDGSAGQTTTKVAVDNTWYHAVVTWTGTTIKVYIDTVDVSGGGFTASSTLSLNNGATNPTINLGSFFWAPNNFNHYFQGGLDEVALFDYELSASDIQDIYDATDIAGKKCADLSAMATPPITWYRMGD
jgi:hypothetical protein